MNDSLLMLQLVFNLVMLVAIILLARTPSAVSARPAQAKKPKPARERGRGRRRARKRAQEDAPPPHLEALLSSTERTELVAERMLRERLARLEHAAGSGR
jgi:hypothetical protein